MLAFPRLSGVLAWQPGHLLLLVVFVFILPLQRREAVEGEEGGGRGLGREGREPLNILVSH